MPLPEQWAEASGGFRDRVLAFWVRASETDEWTFIQLRALLADMIDSGETIPPTLQAWANEYAVGRREPPIRKGRKSYPEKDIQILWMEIFLTENFGVSKRSAHGEIAKAFNRSQEGVESAARRARRRPPGAA